MVTHLTTDLPVSCLNRVERTGSLCNSAIVHHARTRKTAHLGAEEVSQGDYTFELNAYYKSNVLRSSSLGVILFVTVDDLYLQRCGNLTTVFASSRRVASTINPHGFLLGRSDYSKDGH